MTAWFEDHVLLDGAGGPAMFYELDDLLPHDWRLACFVATDAWRSEPGGHPSSRIEDWEDPPAEMRYPKGWDHEHCEFFICCTMKIMRSDDPEEAVGYVAVVEGRYEWLCRQCGEALLRWRETAECRAYMERRARGLPGPPGDG